MLLNKERISVITTSRTLVKESAAPHLVLRGDLILFSPLIQELRVLWDCLYLLHVDLSLAAPHL